MCSASSSWPRSSRGPTTADDLFDLIRRAYPYRELAPTVFDATLDMLAGRYPSDLFAELRPRVNWDRVSGDVERPARGPPARRRQRRDHPRPRPLPGQPPRRQPGRRTRRRDGLRIAGRRRLRPRDEHLAGHRIGPDRVEVVPAPGEPAARLPFWKGDTLGRSIATGQADRTVRQRDRPGSEPTRLPPASTDYHLDDLAARTSSPTSTKKRRDRLAPHRPDPGGRTVPRRDRRLARGPPLPARRPGPRTVGNGPQPTSCGPDSGATSTSSGRTTASPSDSPTATNPRSRPTSPSTPKKPRRTRRDTSPTRRCLQPGSGKRRVAPCCFLGGGLGTGPLSGCNVDGPPTCSV